MSRFQAMTNPVLDQELESLREEMGLREGQRAELLRELASMAAWLVSHSRAGRTIEARGPDGVEVFRHPALTAATVLERVVVDEEEATELQALLDTDAQPSDSLRATLVRLSDPKRKAPRIRWPKR